MKEEDGDDKTLNNKNAQNNHIQEADGYELNNEEGSEGGKHEENNTSQVDPVSNNQLSAMRPNASK